MRFVALGILLLDHSKRKTRIRNCDDAHLTGMSKISKKENPKTKSDIIWVFPTIIVVWVGALEAWNKLF